MRVRKWIGRVALLLCVSLSVPSFAYPDPPTGKNFPSLLTSAADAPLLKRVADSLYNNFGLGAYGLQRDVFFNAYKGLRYLHKQGKVKKPDVITICDYSQSSRNKRLYVIDLVNGRMLFNTYVSHGVNSGDEFATTFSNLTSSNKSSLGFMLTAETYIGQAGYSIRFDGLEKGMNDNVKQRNIVLHGSRWVNEAMVRSSGDIVNSLGCPAVPYSLHSDIINTIKGGSLFYVHHTDPHYASLSPVLTARFDLDAGSVGLYDVANQAKKPVVKAK